MAKYFLCVLILICGSIFFVLADESEQKSGIDEARVTELIKQLESEQETEWLSAAKELIKMGDGIIPFLEEAMKGNNTAVTRRAGLVLKKINQYRLAKNFEVSTVTLNTEEEPVNKILETMEMQTGNKIKRGKFKDVPITVDFKNTPYWEALDIVANLSGNFYGEDPQAGGWGPRPSGFRSGSMPKYPVAYEGPFKTTLLGATKEMDYDTGAVNMKFELQTQIEPRLKKFSAQNWRVIEAITVDGQSLSLKEKNDVYGGWGISRSGKVSCSSGWSAPSINNIPVDVKKLKKLTIGVSCKFVLETNKIKFDDLLQAKGSSRELEGLSMTISNVKETGEGFEVSLILKGKKSNMSCESLNPVLVNQQGTIIAEGWARSASSSSAQTSMTIEFYRKRSSKNKEEPESPALVFTVPAKSIVRKFKFSFRDVSLP